MVEVAAGSVGKQREHRRSFVRGKTARECAHVVGRHERPARRVGMHREVHKGQLGVLIRRLKIDDAYFGIDGAGGTNDLGIEFAGVPSHCAVFHEESAIER